MVPLHLKVYLTSFSHDRSNCFYAHNFNDYRRDPLRFTYEVFTLLFRLVTALHGIKIRPLIVLNNQDAKKEWNAINVMAGLRINTILII